jgi:hypothetical protein
VPAVLVNRFTTPVEALMDNPDVEAKLPPAVPVRMTFTAPALLQ